MPNPRFLTDRCIKAATISANPALLSTKPESFLLTQDRWDTARSTSNASQEFKLTWPAAQRVNMAALGFHNLTTAAQWRIQLYSDAAWTTQVLDNAAQNLFAHTGISSISNVDDPEFRIYRNAARYWTVQTNVQSAKITITDAANPAGNFDFARLMIGEYSELSRQVQPGGVQMWEATDTGQSGAGSGSAVSDKRANYLMGELTHDILTAATDQEIIEAWHNYCGLDRDFFFSLFPEDGTVLELRKQGFFKFQRPDAVDRHEAPLARSRLALRGM